jgi:type IV secretion system protein VirB1
MQGVTMSLTLQAALALALQCAPAIDPNIIVAIGQHESGLDPLTIHDNTTGQSLHGDGVIVAAARLIAAGHSVDLGLMQINSHNLDLLGLPLRDAFAACRSVEAAARLLALFSRYNTGSPTKGIINGYAPRVVAVMDSIRAIPSASVILEAPHNSASPRPTLASQLSSFSDK